MNNPFEELRKREKQKAEKASQPQRTETPFERINRIQEAKKINPPEQISENFSNKKWEVRNCPEGKDCWCRMIFIKDTDELIIPGAVIGKELAEYIVKLQNKK